MTHGLAAPAALDESEQRELLYILARDNEDEQIAQILGTAPDVVERLVPAVFDHPDPQARWQFATILPAALGHNAMAYLGRLLRDSDAYVRRRARAAVDELGAA